MKIDLSGVWEFRLDGEKEGLKKSFAKRKFNDTIVLPNTTSYAKKGEPNRARETGFLTEVYKFEGYAWYRKEVELPLKTEKEIKSNHYFLTLERTRVSTIWVDGKKVGTHDSFIAKHVYDLTGYITNSKPVITIMVSNTDYVAAGGHMTSPDTQTNWNGILGEICLEICDKAFINSANTECNYDAKVAVIKTNVTAFKNMKASIKLSADLCRLKDEYLQPDSDISVWDERAKNQQALATDMKVLDKYLNVKKNAIKADIQSKNLKCGSNELVLNLGLPKNVKEWDEEDPNVYRIHMQIVDSKDEVIAEKTLWFGYRKFVGNGDHFTINGRKTFLRGRHQGMLFPLSGFAPMNVTGWLRDFKIVKDWGLNHERCHTCTPPEAAFIAADLLGFYFQPEIPFWGTWVGKDEEKYPEAKAGQEFLTQEGFRILESFAGHPSFVMMSMGNELWGNAEDINRLIGGYKKLYPEINYVQGSNNFQWMPCILENDDFFSGVRFSINRQIRGSYAQCDAPLGYIQKGKPSTNWNYDNAIRPDACDEKDFKAFGSVLGKNAGKSEIEIQYGTGVKKVEMNEATGELIPHIPVVSHEIGQYFIYPDYDEINKYNGVLQARNLQVFQERLDDNSLYKRAVSYHKSSGALAIECYKQELEAALRSKYMAGYQILDLQDFTGQGTALVGPLNGLMENKGLISPKEWRSFCDKVVVLGEFDDYVLEDEKPLEVSVKLSYYTKNIYDGLKLSISLADKASGEIVYKKNKQLGQIIESGLYSIGKFNIEIPESKDIASYMLKLEVLSGKEVVASNGYVFWKYPKIKRCKPSKNVAVTSNMADTLAAVDEGKSILLYLSPEDNNRSIEGAYCTDFWNYPMFRSISESMNKQWPVGTLGALIAKNHPALGSFPCEDYLTPQWFDIIERSKASVLNGIGFRPVVTVIDNCERNDNLGIIYEFEIMDGKKGPCHVMVVTSPLPELIKEGNMAAAHLEKSLIKYLAGGEYICEVRTNASALNRLFD